MKTNRRIAMVLAVALLCALVLTACGGKTTGTVTEVYQKLVSGPVHTYLLVELEDGTKVEVQLPDDDSVWNAARKSAGKQVTLKSAGDAWTFVDFVK